MKVSDIFDSAYLKAEDLQGREHTVVIADVSLKTFENGNKLLLTFQNRKKGLVANKTNVSRISSFLGGDTDNWIGREIVIYPDLVDFKGEAVPAIRVKAPLRRATAPAGNGGTVTNRGGYDIHENARPNPAPAQRAAPVSSLDDDSDIPF